MAIKKNKGGRIIKVKSHKPFTMIDNEPLQKKELSWKAKGLLAYLMSLPEDWKIYVNELSNHAKDGIDSTSSGMKELIKFGYVTKERIHEEGTGYFSGYDYFVTDTPVNTTIIGKPVNGLSKNGLSVNGKSNTIKETYTKETPIQKTNSINAQAQNFKIIIESSFDVKREIQSQNLLNDSPENRIQVWSIYKIWIEHESFDSLWSFYGDRYPEVDRIKLMKVWVTKADWYTVTQVKVNLVQGWIKRANQEIQKFKNSSNGKTRNNKNLISETDARAVFDDLMQNGI